ncbi:MAG: urea transporter, partial [Bacteroides sp.]|nr:urea transporter [Bacteroides sp.]
SMVSLLTVLYFQGAGNDIVNGLYGFSPVLTAIALGCTFYRPNLRTAIWALLGVLVTVFVQAGMDILMLPFGIPTLTAPFCIATWLFLLPMYAFDEKKPNHSHWHNR